MSPTTLENQGTQGSRRWLSAGGLRWWCDAVRATRFGPGLRNFQAHSAASSDFGSSSEDTISRVNQFVLVPILVGVVACEPQKLGHVASPVSSLEVQDQIEGVSDIALYRTIGEIHA